MKNKILSSVLISMAFPVCGNAVPVTGDELNIGTGNTVLAGSKSGAIGTDNEASGASLAVGMTSSALGTGSAVVGESVMVDNVSPSSVVLGNFSAISNSEASVILGGSSGINREMASLVAGTDNHIGTTVNQWGVGNVLLGFGNNLNKEAIAGNVVGTVLLGKNNSATDSRTWVLGEGNIGQTGTVTLGMNAATVPDAALIVGTGTVYTSARSNGLVVLKDGTVQIPGSLVIGGSAEPALTTTTAATAGYLKNGPNATGAGAVALGSAAQATGSGAYAIGTLATSLGNFSVAIGNRSQASANNSFATGYFSLASAEFSTAIGYQSEATGVRSIALAGGKSGGIGSVSFTGGNATADYSFATLAHTASGVGSVALAGYSPFAGSSTASGAGASVFGGLGSVASGDVSFAAGYQTTTSAAHSTAFGSRNLSAGTGLVPADHTGWVETEALFELGNAKPSLSPAQYSNAITTLKNGRTTLTNKFWVSTTPEVVPIATDASAGAALVVEGHTELKGNTKLKGKVTLEQAQGDISMGIYQ